MIGSNGENWDKKKHPMLKVNLAFHDEFLKRFNQQIKPSNE